MYGSFALVLGLMAFLYLSAQMTVFAAEVNVVRARRLWPRSIVQPPLTPADREVLSSLALEGKRRPEQYVGVGFIDTAHDENEDGPPDESDPLVQTLSPPEAPGVRAHRVTAVFRFRSGYLTLCAQDALDHEGGRSDDNGHPDGP